MSDRGWIGVDLDGTLAHYDYWRGPFHIGPPVPSMVARVHGWLREGYTVKIFTARVAGRSSDEIAMFYRVLTDWLTVAGLPKLDVTCCKDMNMVELWDDRAVRVIHNTGQPVE